MTSPAYELARYLETQGVGVWGSSALGVWSLAVGQGPDVPNTTITLQDEGGGEPDTDELDIQDCAISVLVRSGKEGADYLTAYAKAEEIRGLLITPAPLITENMHFIGVRMLTNISNAGRDDNDRQILLATYQAQRQVLE